MPVLTDADRALIRRARDLARLSGTDAFKEHAGETDLAMAYGVTLAEAQHVLGELARRLERLGGS